AIGAIAGAAIPLVAALAHLWQAVVLVLAAGWLIRVRRGGGPALVRGGGAGWCPPSSARQPWVSLSTWRAGQSNERSEQGHADHHLRRGGRHVHDDDVRAGAAAPGVHPGLRGVLPGLRGLRLPVRGVAVRRGRGGLVGHRGAALSGREAGRLTLSHVARGGSAARCWGRFRPTTRSGRACWGATTVTSCGSRAPK